jgi:hypothetical protein
MVELSDGIVITIDDLTSLIAIITDEPKDKVQIEVKEIETKNCCLNLTVSCCSKTIPICREIDTILVKYNNFKLKYPKAYRVMNEKFNISLNYVLLNDNTLELIPNILGEQK